MDIKNIFKKILLPSTLLAAPIVAVTSVTSCSQSSTSNNQKIEQTLTNEINNIELLIDKKIKDIQNYSAEQAQQELLSVFNTINEKRNEIKNIETNFLKNIDQNKDFNDLINDYNNSLKDHLMGVENQNELMHYSVDGCQINGLLNNINQEDIDVDKKGIEKDFNKTPNLAFKNNMFNQIIRTSDKFKYMYYELSIFPFLFQKVYGMPYDFFMQDSNNSSNQYYANWMYEQYRPFVFWNLNVKKVNPTLSSDTKNSYFYNFFNKINFINSIKSYFGYE